MTKRPTPATLGASVEIERLVEELISQLTEAYENAVVARARVLTEEFLAAAAPARAEEPVVAAVAPPRATLRPTAVAEPAPVAPVVTPPPARVEGADAGLQPLEDHIRDQVPS